MKENGRPDADGRLSDWSGETEQAFKDGDWTGWHARHGRAAFEPRGLGSKFQPERERELGPITVALEFRTGEREPWFQGNISTARSVIQRKGPPGLGSGIIMDKVQLVHLRSK